MNNTATLFLILCCFSWYNVFTQCATIFKPLEQRLDESYMVVEGKVLKKESFQGERLIYTDNLIEVYKIFKGDAHVEQITAVTTGGQVGDYLLKVFPSLELHVGQTGIFLLKLYGGNQIDRTRAEILRPVADGYSFIPYDFYHSAARDGADKYDDLEELYSRIRAKTGQLHIVRAKPQKVETRSPLAPSITSFTPSSVNGGRGETITITGTGFEATIGTVFFS